MLWLTGPHVVWSVRVCHLKPPALGCRRDCRLRLCVRTSGPGDKRLVIGVNVVIDFRSRLVYGRPPVWTTSCGSLSICRVRCLLGSQVQGYLCHGRFVKRHGPCRDNQSWPAEAILALPIAVRRIRVGTEIGEGAVQVVVEPSGAVGVAEVLPQTRQSRKQLPARPDRAQPREEWIVGLLIAGGKEGATGCYMLPRFIYEGGSGDVGVG